MVSSRNGALSPRLYWVHRGSVHQTCHIPPPPLTNIRVHIETLAFHGGVTLGCYITLRCLDWYNSYKKTCIPPSGIRQQFRLATIPRAVWNRADGCPPRLSHVPLTLLYSSLSKLFLLFLLSIWRPSTTNSTQIFTERAKGTILAHPIINSALEILDDDKLDKEWVIRNILGGMAAGFGLRGISTQIMFPCPDVNCFP